MFRNKIVNILLIVVLSLGLLGTVLFVAYKTVAGPSKDTGPKVMTGKEIAAAQYDLGKMTTNLQGDSLIQVTISLQGDSANAKKELDERKAQVKDIINSILHNTTSGDIQKADGLQKLKQQIVSNLNKVMLDGKVVDAYLSDIVVQ